MKLGISGLAGSFSEEAALQYLQRTGIEAEIIYLLDMAGVLAAVENSSVDIGIFPVVNSIGGLVKPAFEAMGKYSFEMIDKLALEVNQCLMALPDISNDNIQKIISHPQALKQCSQYLSSHFPLAQQIEDIDTAQSAKSLSQGLFSNDTAVIAPARAAKIYKLNILASNIQDVSPNITTFIITKKRKTL